MSTAVVPKLRLRGVRKQFGDKIVLDGIDLDVMPGTSMVVIGGSGSGKSVLLKCIIGIMEPDEGVIEIDGQDVMRVERREREAARARIGMLFQNGALFDSLPVWENVAFGVLARQKISRADAKVRAVEVLAQVGLAAERRRPAAGGTVGWHAEARRARAAPSHRSRTCCSSTSPTTGLDPIMGAIIDGLIVDCVKRLGSTAVAITHDMASARRIGDRAAMIYGGRIIWEGAAAQLMDSGNPVVDQFTHGEREGPIKMELRR